MATILDVTINEFDVIAIHRLPSRNRSEIPQIIVRMLNHDKKNKLIYNARNIKPTTEGITEGTSNPICINDHLSKANSYILKRAKELKKSGLIKFAWVKNYKIYVRERDDSTAYHISCNEDLDRFKTTIQSKLPATTVISGSSSSSFSGTSGAPLPVSAGTRKKKKTPQQTTLNRYHKTTK